MLRYTYVAPLAFRNTAFCSVSHARDFKGNIHTELQNSLTPKEQFTRTQQLWAIWIQFTSSYLHRIAKAFWSLQIFFRISSGKNEIMSQIWRRMWIWLNWPKKWSTKTVYWNGGTLPRGGRDFPHTCRPALEQHPASYKMSTGSLAGIKWPKRGVAHPTPSSAEVKERVALYLYYRHGPSWSVLGWTSRFH
jgi:hypothetical protein